MAAGTTKTPTRPASAGPLSPETQAAVDNDSATESLAPDGAPDPRAAKPVASPEQGGTRAVLLPTSRQNGAFDGPVRTIGEGDDLQKATIILTVTNLFGGADGDVALSGKVYTRRDSTQEWEPAASFSNVRDVGAKTASAMLKRETYFGGAVSGSDGGHAVEVEVVADIR
jgi:hypothetical protein